MKSTKNASKGEKASNNQAWYCSGKNKPWKLSKETNSEELFTPPKICQKSDVKRPTRNSDEKMICRQFQSSSFQRKERSEIQCNWQWRDHDKWCSFKNVLSNEET